jgi:hypothetical protein
MPTSIPNIEVEAENRAIRIYPTITPIFIGT